MAAAATGVSSNSGISSGQLNPLGLQQQQQHPSAAARLTAAAAIAAASASASSAGTGAAQAAAGVLYHHHHHLHHHQQQQQQQQGQGQGQSSSSSSSTFSAAAAASFPYPEQHSNNSSSGGGGGGSHGVGLTAVVGDPSSFYAAAATVSLHFLFFSSLLFSASASAPEPNLSLAHNNWAPSSRVRLFGLRAFIIRSRSQFLLMSSPPAPVQCNNNRQEE